MWKTAFQKFYIVHSWIPWPKWSLRSIVEGSCGKKSTSNLQDSSLLSISEQEVKKMLNALSTEKSAGVYIMPPKSFKLAVNYLVRPLAIN